MGAFLTGCVVAVGLSVGAWVVYGTASVSAIEEADSPSVLVGREVEHLSENEKLSTR